MIINDVNSIMRWKTSPLPEGYTQLNYLESNGSQWLNTGIYLNNYDPFKIDFQVTRTTSITNGGIAGAAATSWTSKGYGVVYFFYSSYYQLYIYGRHRQWHPSVCDKFC